MRWTPTLAVIVGLLVGVAMISFLPTSLLFVRTPEANHATATGIPGERWACPMMDFIGHQPGTCPVCGMQMTKVTAGELTVEQQHRMGVELTTLAKGPAQILIRAHGVADYDRRFSHVIVPRVDGRITKRYEITADGSGKIAAGDPLIDLSSPTVMEAQERLATAIRLDRTVEMDMLIEQFSRWNLSHLATQILSGGMVQETVTILAPFNGLISLRDLDLANTALEVGSEIKADTPLLRLVDPDRLALIVQVPESQARFLTEADPVTLHSDALGPLPGIPAVIGQLAPEINPELRTREVRIYLSGARSILQPGSLVTAHFTSALDANLQPTGGNPAHHFPLIPKTAVLSTGVRHVAWRVAERTADGRLRFELAPLALGPRIEDAHGHDTDIVRGGLKVGDEVATQGAFLIDSQAQLAGTASLLFPKGAPAPAAHQH